MPHRFHLPEMGIDGSLDRLNRCGGFPANFRHRPFGRAVPVEVFTHLADPLQRDHLAMVRIDHVLLEPRSVFGRWGNAIRRLRPGASSALRSAFNFGLVFRDFNVHRRQVRHLPFFHPFHRSLFQVRLEMMASQQSVDLNPIRVTHCLQCVSWMIRLSAAPPLMSMALTLRQWFCTPIAGQRFAVVAAVLRQLIFEGLNPFGQK
jgi:hypothetical protein